MTLKPYYRLLFCGLSLIFTPSISLEGETNKNSSPNLELLKEFSSNITSVRDSKVSDFYEIGLNGDIVYLHKDGKLLFYGDLIDLEKKANLTEETKSNYRKEAINKIPDSDKIVYKSDNEKYIIDVYTDYTCQYCIRFHKDIKKINDLGITVRYLSFPRAGANSEIANNMQLAYCSENKQKAFNDLKLKKTIPSGKCKPGDNQVKEQFDLALKIGVNATPTIILENGALSPGYLPPENLLELIKNSGSQ